MTHSLDNTTSSKDALDTVLSNSLAARTKRLVARIIDVIMLVFVFIVGYYFSNITGLNNVSNDGLFSYKMFRYCLVMQAIYFIINYKFLLNGQTIGKKIMRIRVVTLSNTIPSISSIYLVRYLLVGLIFSAVSFLNFRYFNMNVLNFAFVIDLIFVFSRSRRCLHDYLAGTKVINIIN